MTSQSATRRKFKMPSDAEITKGLEKFKEKQDKLYERMKTCKYIKYPDYVSIPPSYPGCTHPKSKYGVCSRGDECPLLKDKKGGK